MHKNIIFFLFTSFFIQTFELVDDIWGHVVLYTDYTTRTNLKITSRFFQQLFQKNPNFLIYGFIDELFRLKDNQENFKKLVQECNPEYFYVLQGFDYFKSKRDRNIEIDLSNIESLCRSIVTNNKCNYVKFFISYSLISQIYKDEDNKHIDHFIMRQKVLNDVCTFFDKEVSSENFYNIPDEIIQKRYQNKDICHDYVNKALKEQKLSVLIFMFNFLCRSFCVGYRIYSPGVFGEKDKNILEKFKTYKDLKMLVQANVPMYQYSDGYHNDKGNFVTEDRCPISLVEVAICAGNINRARILLNILFEQDEKIELRFLGPMTYDKNRIGILPSLLENKASDVIRLLFKSDFRYFDKWIVDGATHEQVKEIVTLMHEIYKNEAPSKINKCLFLHTAAEENDIALVQFLLDHGANINESCMCNVNFQYPPIGYSLNNDEMIDFFIKNIHLLDKGKVEFFDWKKPYKTANIRKLIEKDYFCEGEVFSFICKAIQLNNSLLYELVFKNKKLVNEYKALDAWGKHTLFRKAVDKKDKRIINLFRHNGFNMFEKFVINHPRDPALGYENKECLRDSLSFINHKYIIQDYEKHKQNMTCEQYLCVLDICKDHGVLRDHLLKNDDIGKINLLPMILSEEIIEKRINQILDRPLFKKKSLFNWFAAKNIKNLLLRDQQHLRLIE